MAASKQARTYVRMLTHFRNAVPLVWGSLRLAPINLCLWRPAIVPRAYCSQGFSTNENEDARHKKASWRPNRQSVKNVGGSNWGKNRATYWTPVHLPEGEDVSRWMLRHHEESDTKQGCQIWSQGWGTLLQTERKGNSCRSMCWFIHEVASLHTARLVFV